MLNQVPALHLYFDERDNRTEETVLNDFPVRDKKLVLHIRRRRWLKPDGTSCVLDVYPKLVAKGTRFSGSPAIFRGRLSRSSRYMCSVPVQKMPKKSVGRTVTECLHCL